MRCRVGGGPAVELSGVRRTYGRGGSAVHAPRGMDMTLPRGSFTAVMGPSGSGKSTFLQVAAGLDRPSSGTVRLGGEDITRLGEKRLTELRRSRVGFVFQSLNLLPSLTVRQNVLLPLRLDGQRPGRGRADELLSRVGLVGYGRRRPSELSGGQQQRVAIARALVADPEVIFADRRRHHRHGPGRDRRPGRSTPPRGPDPARQPRINRRMASYGHLVNGR